MLGPCKGLTSVGSRRFSAELASHRAEIVAWVPELRTAAIFYFSEADPDR